MEDVQNVGFKLKKCIKICKMQSMLMNKLGFIKQFKDIDLGIINWKLLS